MYSILLALGIILMMGIPIAIVLILVGSGFLLYNTPDLNLLVSGAQRVYEGIISFPLLAIPLFIFVGLMMNQGGMSQRLFRFALNIVGFLPGGLGHVNVVASMIFAGMTGSAVAEAAGLGVIQIKAMKDEGYDLEFAGALTAASSTIGPVIPPSIPLVVYGWLTGSSVAALFLAGFLPGITMGLSLMLMVAIISKKKKYPRHPFPSLRELLRSTVDALLALFTVVIIIGGMLWGFFTPTEAAAIASLYAFGIVTFVYREVGFKDILKVLAETVDVTSKVMFIIAAASFFAWVVRYLGIPQQMLNALLAVTKDPTMMVIIMTIIVLILGCFLEGIAIMLITIPIFQPILTTLGVDLVYFGIVFTLSIMMGLLTPPFGLSLFTVSAITGQSVGTTARAVVPFLIVLFIPLILCIFSPGISLFIPNLLLGAR